MRNTEKIIGKYCITLMMGFLILLYVYGNLWFGIPIVFFACGSICRAELDKKFGKYLQGKG